MISTDKILELRFRLQAIDSNKGLIPRPSSESLLAGFPDFNNNSLSHYPAKKKKKLKPKKVKVDIEDVSDGKL